MPLWAMHELITRDETADFLDAQLGEWDACGFGCWIAVERGSGRILGYVGVSVPGFLPEILPAVEVGWRFDPAQGELSELSEDALGPAQALPRSFWGMHRQTRCDLGSSPTLLETLEDSPFYTRNLVSAQVAGRVALTMHESVDLRRFCARPTQLLLPFRIRRA